MWKKILVIKYIQNKNYFTLSSNFSYFYLWKKFVCKKIPKRNICKKVFKFFWLTGSVFVTVHLHTNSNNSTQQTIVYDNQSMEEHEIDMVTCFDVVDVVYVRLRKKHSYWK